MAWSGSQFLHLSPVPRGLPEGAEGESIHTENSYKFDLPQIAALAAGTGFEVRRTWTDSEERFASNLLVAV